MKIVVLDGYTENPGDLSWAGLEALGEVTVYDRTAYQESPLIAERIGDAEIVASSEFLASIAATILRCAVQPSAPNTETFCTIIVWIYGRSI